MRADARWYTVQLSGPQRRTAQLGGCAVELGDNGHEGVRGHTGEAEVGVRVVGGLRGVVSSC